MERTQLILYIIKLVLGGLVALFAIILWGRLRDGAWMSLIAGIVINYAGYIYNMLVDMHLVELDKYQLFGLPLTSLIFSVIPQLLFLIAFIIMICKTK